VQTQRLARRDAALSSTTSREEVVVWGRKHEGVVDNEDPRQARHRTVEGRNVRATMASAVYLLTLNYGLR
jgi:hypothetical protein